MDDIRLLLTGRSAEVLLWLLFFFKACWDMSSQVTIIYIAHLKTTEVAPMRFPGEVNQLSVK